jgi:hypothetical protein
MSRTLEDVSTFEAVRPNKVTGLPMRKVRGHENNRLRAARLASPSSGTRAPEPGIGAAAEHVPGQAGCEDRSHDADLLRKSKLICCRKSSMHRHIGRHPRSVCVGRPGFDVY